MHTQEVRRQFLNYFKERRHAVIASSPVVPHDDPTLLFTNAGMNQFKDVFLGNSHRDYKCATTSQKCIRVGGKHNDLDNVGHTNRHLTFFEMLGNFSFGDYFKEEAIRFAWEASTQIFGFDPDRIWPSVFREDDEAFELWTKYVPAGRITRLDEKDNFWAMGDTGPCGPCSELYYDRGPKYGSATKLIDDPENLRFLEFWNLVFMQFNRGSDGIMNPLPKPSIDTGAGLERVISLKMDVNSVFETDILRGLIAQVEQISGKTYDLSNKNESAFRVIADHLRCLAFAIADGVQPSNVDRGYVLRKVLRRAVRYGRMLGMEEPFLAKVLPRLVLSMEEDYSELKKAQDRIADILTTEEEAFIRTLRRGGNMLNAIIENAKTHGQRISGDDMFKLKDTYGFPLEEIELLAKDGGLTVDKERYLKLEQEAKERSRSVHKTTHQIASESIFADFAKQYGATQFVGYDQHSAAGKILSIIIDGQLVDSLEEGQEGMVILDKTPFYAEMGGQVGDSGVLESGHQYFQTSDTLSPYKGLIGHVGKLKKGKLSIGDKVTATINSSRRQKIANNHTATHLMHWALHEVLGEHIKQAGSVVDEGRLRFDFSHHKALTQDEIHRIEDLVNAKIRENTPVKWYELSYDEAQQRQDIKQFFGEKYGATVRVIDIDYSKELCGGTHTSFAGNIGLFRIAKESSIAAGVRRIEAITGEEAEAFARQSELLIDKIASSLKTASSKVMERLEKLIEENKELSAQLKNAKQAKLSELADNLAKQLAIINTTPLIAAEIDTTPEEMRTVAEELMQKLPSAVVVLATRNEGNCSLLVRISDDLIAKGTKAPDIIKVLAPIIGGSGGGKPNSAQAGGKEPQNIGEALARVRSLLEQQ
jgi:alanyl-tRNA synthetase